MTALLALLAGAITFGFGAIGLFFLRYWLRSKDGLFLAFAIAFWLLGIGQALTTLSEWPVEERSWLYLLRLAAFLLIIIAIWRKNRGELR
ncbi:DUF5985 family protein [Novosphingobium sp. Gsoil 351]|uniref:DUF5985 family protein n=1 Tax=Novosphingobium sp. Gsoil 351 TaxID=2675225 RepID=UPI0012B49831|nr:DUF5985 family protein [Novosphingobium sp. Gsoil 351]QGN54124.1 hypothetical protein GKE62_05755 [Novosphingobium sp. Gsoil 351]